MKRISTFVILFFCISFSVMAQPGQPLEPAWTKTFGGTGWDRAYVTRVINNEILIAGGSGSWDGDFEGTLKRPQDMFVIKTDLEGNIIWKKRIGGDRVDMAWGIEGTADGGYIVVGSTNSIDGHATNGGYHEGSGSDIWVVRLGRSGNIIWQRAYGGSRNDEGYSIMQTDDDGDGQKDDGFILSGHTASHDGDVSGHHGNNDAWVVKIAANGDLQWQRSLGGSKHEYARDVKQTPDGGYLVIADTWSSDHDVEGYHRPAGSTLNTYSDWWIVKLDNTGEIVWKKCYGGDWGEVPVNMQVTDDGFIVTGNTESFNGDAPMPRYGSYDVLVVKFDFEGNVQWQQRIGGKDHERGSAVVQTQDGGYAIVASCLSGKDGNLGDTKPKGDYDILLVKFDKGGNIQWKERFGGSRRDEAHSLALTSDGCFVLAGGTESTDGHSAGNHGGMDALVIKFCAPLSPVLQAELDGFQAKIEPRNDYIVLSWRTLSEQNIAYFEIERSTDGQNFISIGRVNGAGTSGNLHNYIFTDISANELAAAVIYYRLRQVDADGKSAVSQVVMVSPKPKYSGKLKVYPNPSSGRVQVQLKNAYAGPVKATVYNIGGQVVKTEMLSKAINMLDLSGQNKGSYFIRLDNSDGIIEITQVVLK